MTFDRKDILLIIDFQNVYLPGQPWACPAMPRAMEQTVRLARSGVIENALLTRFVADPAAAGAWRRYNTEYASINADPYLNELAQPMTSLAKTYPVFEKSTYSSLKCPEVRSFIEKTFAREGEGRLLLSGVVAECCILATMMDAIDLGYSCVYLPQCIAGQSAENEEHIRRLAESFAPIHTLVGYL